jgi:predicted Rossmann fold flavoprotein
LQDNLKVAIIGAGASGIFSSILLAKNDIDVTLYEKNNKIGKKLLATGNGRCNITNRKIKLSNFHTSSNIKNIKKILDNFTYNDIKHFFSTIGIEFFINEQNNRVYPMSQSASSVVDALEYEAIKYGVNLLLNTEVKSIKKDKNKFIVNNTQYYDNIIISTGSVAMPKLGGCNSGYGFAKNLGHNVVSPFASLVQLECSDKNLDMISGVKIDGKIVGKTGDVLFTKYGLSGSLILDISRDISYKLQSKKEIIIAIDTLPYYTKEKLFDILSKRVLNLSNRPIELFLDGITNKKLSKFIIKKAKIDSNKKVVKFLTNNDLNKIINTTKQLTFTVIKTKGFQSCEVCAGGVELNDINTNTMESKITKGLYFTGEVLDVDGDCGGFNLHFAWASGYCCANGIKNLINKQGQTNDFI